MEPVRRDRRQARADARRHEQLSHQQPAGAPARRAGRVPRHRPRAARLRDHRPGHDLAHHREQARGAAPVPRGSGGRVQVQGAAPGDREPPEGHAREPDARRGHPARAERQPREARVAGRGCGPLSRAAAGRAAQAAPALVPASSRRRARGGTRQPGGRRGDRRARIEERRPASRRGRARADPAIALRRQRRAARGAGRARPGGARGEPARGADPLRRRRSRAARPPARRARGAERRLARARGRRDGRARAARQRRSRPTNARSRRSPRELAAHGERLGALEETLREAQSRSNEQRSVVAAVQQQIQVLRRRGAQHRRAADAGRDAARSAGRRGEGAGRDRARRARGGAARRRRRRGEAQGLARRGSPTGRRACPRSTTSAGRCRISSTRKRVGMPSWARGSLRCRRCRRRCRSRTSSSPGSSRHGLDSLAGPLDADPDRARLGGRARGGAARAARRARGRPARHGARVRCRRAAGAPRVLHRAGRALRARRIAPCRAWPTCCISATRASTRCSATGSKASTPRATSTRRSPRARA